jgi:hypothetical protein
MSIKCSRKVYILGNGISESIYEGKVVCLFLFVTFEISQTTGPFVMLLLSLDHGASWWLSMNRCAPSWFYNVLTSLGEFIEYRTTFALKFYLKAKILKL